VIDCPTDREANLDYRSRLISIADDDPQAQRILFDRCAESAVFWFNTFCWTYDAKGDKYKALGYTSPHMPFILFPFQEDTINKMVEKIEKGEDIAIEKSRDMGMSWLAALLFQYFWTFRGAGYDFLIGSRKEKYVDELGVMSAVFPKIRYNLNRQPEWLLPMGFKPKQHDNIMRLQNPENGNAIVGEANNKAFGTSGRYAAVMFDEFAKWEHTDTLAWQSCSDVTNCKIAISSAWGRANHFYKIRSGLAGDIDVHRLHWKLHPLKDDAWYEAEKKRRTPADLAAEVDIDYQAAIVGRAYTSFNYETHCGDEADWPVWNKDLPIDLLCDFNILPMSWAITHDMKGTDYQFSELVDSARTTTADQMMAFCSKYKEHKNKTLNVYGDPSGKYGDTRGHSSDYDIIKRIGKQNGWSVYTFIAKGHPQHKDRIETANKRLSDWEFGGISHYKVNPKECPVTVASWEGTRRKGDQIDKSDGVEHITDGITYKWTYLWPINKGFVGSIMR